MIGKKRNREVKERLDHVGREIVRASSSTEAEMEEASASPFLYTRIRSRIAAEREQHEERERWFTLFGIAWRAVPAMALVAIFAIALFLSASFSTQSPLNGRDEALLATSEAEVESVVYADNRVLSNDDVLATILNEDDQEASR